MLRFNEVINMAGNSNLHKASKAKNDEFYTRLADIELELKHYRKHFKDKVVFCNCDDPYESNFFKYFAMNFNFLGLKKLIATCYKGSPIIYTQLNVFGDEETVAIIESEKKPYKIEIIEVIDANGDGAIDLTDVEYLLRNKNNVLTFLKGDGDFRSDECIEILKEADIVVTNPPFSLFREYVAQLMEYDKNFIIIGNQNAITYKEIFPLLRDNKMWLGNGFKGGNAFFSVPKEVHYADGVYDEKTGLVKFRNCCWFTNLDIKKRHEEFEFYKKYNPDEYPKYDNYNAINVDKLADIPEDYYGEMGVPITFLDKYNPEQFEIIDINPHFFSLVEKGIPKIKQLTLKKAGKKDPYARILIRRKNNGN